MRTARRRAVRRGGRTIATKHGHGRILLGHQRIETRVGKSAAGVAQAFRFVDRSSGKILTITVYLDPHNRARRMFAGVYTDHKGAPGARLTSGSRSSPRAGAWNTISVRPAAVTSGTIYWLAVLGRGGRLYFRDRQGSSCNSDRSHQRRLNGLPSAWRGGPKRSTCQISAYAQGTAAKPRGGGKKTGAGTTGPPPAGGGTTPTGQPPVVKCTSTVSSMSALSIAVAQAAGGSVICVAPGSYTRMSLSGAHSSDVIVQSESSLDPRGAGKVTIGLSSTVTNGSGGSVAAAIAPGSSHIVLRNLYFTNELSIGYGSSLITVDHNDFSQVGNGDGMMINFATSDCTVPNSPTWSGCGPLAPVSNVTISGNDFHGISSTGTDVLHTNNFRNLRVTGNEISGAVEDGNHVDCLQNVFGGSNLTFDHNYEHDNECQGLFLKDGDIWNVTFDDNLFLRDNLPAVNGGSSASTSQVIDTTNFVAEHNTIWDSKGLTFRCLSSSVPCTATVDHDLFSYLNNGNTGDATFYSLNESSNIFGIAPWSFDPNSSDQVTSNPAFICGSTCGSGTTAGDDYRLARNPNRTGIDWAPSQYAYGPS